MLICEDALMYKYLIRKLIAIKNYYSFEYNYNYSEANLQTSPMLQQLLFSRLLFRFCKFKYFKDLATEIDYPIFKINHQLGYSNDRQCWLLGYKLKTPALQSTIIPPSQQPTPVPDQPQQIRQIQLQYNPLAKQFLSYGDIQKYAEKNDLDICFADEQANELTLVKLRQSVYRKFYQARLHKKNSTAKKHKEIRVPEKISDHDIRNKIANIHSLIKKGEFRFKLFSENDSKQSQKAMEKFCKYLGRAPQIKIEKYELQQKSRGKKSIVIERWNTTMDFSEQSKIDYEKVNKKWRRHLINLKVQKERGDKKSPRFDFEGLENEPIDVQREMIRDLREMSIKLPSKFKDYQILEDMLEMDGKEFYFKSSEKLKKYRESIKQNKLQPQLDKQNQGSQSESDSQSQSGSQSESESQSEQKNLQAGRRIKNPNRQTLLKLKASPQQMKELRKSMGARTVQEILQQMQQVRGSKVQLEAFEAEKLKQLQKQLKEVLRMSGFGGKL